MDHDPGPDAADFTCNGLSYDTHTGTDFALPSLAAMQAGVAVLAAAPGTVAALRDGMPDTGLTPDTAAQIDGPRLRQWRGDPASGRLADPVLPPDARLGHGAARPAGRDG